MSASVYIPKPVILGLLYAGACATGWMFYGSVSEMVSAESPPPTVSPISPAVAGTPTNTPTVAVASAPTNAPTVENAIATGTGTPISASNMTTPGLPVSSGHVAAPGSTFALTTRPNEANPGLLDSAGYVATPGSTFSLTTGPDGSQFAEGTGSGDLAAGTQSEEPGIARSGPGGSASYPLAVPSPLLMGPPSAADASPSTVPAPAFQQPTYATYPFPITYPGSYPVTYPAGYPITYPAGYPVTEPAGYPFPYPGLNAFDAPEVGPLGIRGPASYIEPILSPLPGARSRGLAFSEWESYRTDVAGRNIIATTDDSNVFVNRNGNLNANTGDTDASGLNVTDATNSVIRGTESADEAPYQTVAAAIVDLASEDPGGGLNSDPDDDPDDEADEDEEEDEDADDGVIHAPTAAMPAAAPTAPAVPATPPTGAFAAVISPTGGDDSADDSDDSTPDEFDFPYVEWTQQISGDAASAVHTDEGTTLASGADAVVVGADGYDDDDNRAVGENIVVTRDDSNVVLGGTGDVNAQIGDSEQGAVIMGVDGVFIQGGGAY